MKLTAFIKAGDRLVAQDLEMENTKEEHLAMLRRDPTYQEFLNQKPDGRDVLIKVADVAMWTYEKTDA